MLDPQSVQQLVQLVQDTCPEFCAALTQDEMSKFVRYTPVITLEEYEVLANVGDVGDSFYMIISGVIQLFQVDGEREFEVGQIDPGGLVGEMSFFDKRPRSLRLKSHKGGARLLEINRKMYSRLRIEEPYISSNLLEFVIRSLDKLVRGLSEQNAVLHQQVMSVESC